MVGDRLETGTVFSVVDLGARGTYDFSRRPGIRPLHGEACLTHLGRICWSDARKLCSDVIDDVEIAVWAVVVSQSEVRAYRLCV